MAGPCNTKHGAESKSADGELMAGSHAKREGQISQNCLAGEPAAINCQEVRQPIQEVRFTSRETCGFASLDNSAKEPSTAEVRSVS